MINTRHIRDKINRIWDESILETLCEYISIPNKSPHFDEHWQEHGYMEQAVNLIADWCRQHGPQDMVLDVLQLPGRTPLIYMEIPGHGEETVLLYGHLDKQPEMTGWREGLGPWKPVLEGDRLYGRGGADDGYAVFASLTAIHVLREQGLPHARCVLLIEACEESGSYDLPYYIDALQHRIGQPDLVICLDSGAGDYERLWMTTSLRGNIVGQLTVETLTEGIHSGNGSGIVADSFRIARALLERVEDQHSGNIKLPALHGAIPEQRRQQAQDCAAILGEALLAAYPLHAKAHAVTEDKAELILNRTWRPALTITGADGLPATVDAGNVLRPLTALKLSMRIPPNVCAEKASAALVQAFAENIPAQANVHFQLEDAAAGWHAPVMQDWLALAVNVASQEFFGQPPAYMGEGGSIPFMAMLGEKFPEAQFMITGVLGPHSNAHGPNEFLHLPMVKKLTACVAYVIHAHYQQTQSG
ncbi:MAG: M20 family metallopeptidase [Legionellaceae bacterium]|nr:M20 family metallopeptidase [Legionellaceae bacterium]